MESFIPSLGKRICIPLSLKHPSPARILLVACEGQLDSFRSMEIGIGLRMLRGDNGAASLRHGVIDTARESHSR